MTRVPSGENATPLMPFLVSWADTVTSSRGSPSVTSHTVAVPSLLPATTRDESGLQSMSRT